MVNYDDTYVAILAGSGGDVSDNTNSTYCGYRHEIHVSGVVVVTDEGNPKHEQTVRVGWYHLVRYMGLKTISLGFSRYFYSVHGISIREAMVLRRFSSVIKPQVLHEIFF